MGNYNHYGENPDPVFERWEKLEAGRLLALRRHSPRKTIIEQVTRPLDERWREEELVVIDTAKSFLDAIEGYCKDRNISPENISLEEKVRFLKEYSAFTGIFNSNYPEGVSKEIVNSTFTTNYSKAKRLLEEA